MEPIDMLAAAAPPPRRILQPLTVETIDAEDLNSIGLRAIARVADADYAYRRSDGVEVLVASPETLGPDVVYIAARYGRDGITRIAYRPLSSVTTYWGIADVVDDLLSSLGGAPA